MFQTNEKGQVVTKTSLLKQMEELIEEPGLTCCICREGYKFQVHKHNQDGLDYGMHCVKRYVTFETLCLLIDVMVKYHMNGE